MMERRLFLTGPSGIGKSTLLSAALGERLALAGGFRTVRHRGEDGKPLYFSLETPEGGDLGIFLDLRGRAANCTEVFRKAGALQLKTAPEHPFSVLDEIGGTELLVPEFAEALEAFLAGDAPCIGVLKGAGPAAMLASRMELGEAYTDAHRALTAALQADPQTRILDCGALPREEVQKLISEWVEEYAHESKIL